LRGAVLERRISVMHTPVCDLLNIEFPIFAFSHCRDVVAAVTNAGGLGVLGAVTLTPERLETELNWIEDAVGDKPYGVDLLVPSKYVGVEEGGLSGTSLKDMITEEHRAFVNDLLER
jgi:NAD(P)H-dependent flavin oxidoreductase YrpB (nitropropane dioxygenase family)